MNGEKNVTGTSKAVCHDCDWKYRPQRRADLKGSKGVRMSTAARNHALKFWHAVTVTHVRRWTNNYDYRAAGRASSGGPNGS